MSPHEYFQDQDAIEGSSDQQFGITIAVALAVFAGIRIYLLSAFTAIDWVSSILLTVSALLLLISLVKPEVLHPLNRLWFKLGMVLFKIFNPIILLVIYGLTIFPIAILFKISGKDLLNLKWNKNSESYWLGRKADEIETDMKNQF